jgi:dipeptidyl aminopeptidase/acylaminoacyl peptidase
MASEQKARIPFGAWKSPITSSLVARQSIGLSEVRFDGSDIYWLETRPGERGRSVVVCRPNGGTESFDLTPPLDDGQPHHYNVRTGAHGYGGGAWTVSTGTLYFSNFSDGRLHRQDGVGVPPIPLTPPPSASAKDVPLKYADGVIDHARMRWIGICEDHSDATKRFPDNSIVAVSLGGGNDPGHTLASGHDFYSSPRLSPDGRWLAWLAWDFPNMPWTGTRLCLAELDDKGSPKGAPTLIAGGPTESIFQPEWAPDGAALYFVSDKSGWWNLYAHDLTVRRTRALAPKPAEFGQAQWQFGMSTYAMAGNQLVAAHIRNGLGRLALIDPVSGGFTDLSAKFDLPYTSFSSVRTDGADRVVFRAGSPVIADGIVLLHLSTGRSETLKKATAVADDPTISRYISHAVPISFPTKNGKQSFGLYYPPSNPDCRPPRGEVPPLLVKCHGGPTSSASSALDLKIQYWTSRGIAVLDVNYGGSTGFGREYRNRLRAKWGVVDVDDCVSGAKYLAAQGKADKRRSVITGNSSGGYTALAALTFRNYFCGGASHYGISDIAALAADTHKFEAHYLDWLIGPYPKQKAVYRARSPVFHAGRLSRPVVFFQGDQDRIVPPAQTEQMVEALRRKRTPVGYLLFSGEGHGFRMAENIQRSMDAELYFYSFEVFGIDLHY